MKYNRYNFSGWYDSWFDASASNLNAESSLVSMDKIGNTFSVSDRMKPDTVISRNIPAYSDSRI